MSHCGVQNRNADTAKTSYIVQCFQCIPPYHQAWMYPQPSPSTAKVGKCVGEVSLERPSLSHLLLWVFERDQRSVCVVPLVLLLQHNSYHFHLCQQVSPRPHSFATVMDWKSLDETQRSCMLMSMPKRVHI
jgi:hypothetical protein